MNILSLCDGMSCGQIALTQLGYKIDSYFAAEIKKTGIQVTQDNFPNTIQIGDVNKVSYENGILHTEKGDFETSIDLVMFGSPCQSFSVAMKADKRIGLKDKTKSGLFLECYRILKEVEPEFFFVENVASMKKEDQAILSEMLGVKPYKVNSEIVAPALRNRLYWTNIPNFKMPAKKDIDLQSILTSGYTDRKKARALLCSDSRPLVDKAKMMKRYRDTGFTTIVWEEQGNDESIRYLNQTELERCQTVPEGYTKCLTRNQAADVLGDGWTIDVIKEFFKNLPEKFKEE